MSDSKSGSKNDLNESNMPLLEGEQAEKSGETPEKEQMELEEKKDDSTEKEDKKSKKKKEKKEKAPKGPGCVQVNTQGLDIVNRDVNDINAEINLGFDDVLAEPSNSQGLEGVWRLAFLIFGGSKLWVYRILAALFALPLALLWGAVFGVVTAFHVWFGAPAIRLVEFAFYVFRRVFTGFIRSTVEPVCSSLGAVFSNVGVNQKSRVIQETV